MDNKMDNDPLLSEDSKRYVIFPIKRDDVWAMYKKSEDNFCKTEELHEKFVKLLNRMKPEIMLFQAHRHDPPGQMEGAFRNYNEIEFVEFISKHTGLNMWEKLGVAADKRPIYKL